MTRSVGRATDLTATSTTNAPEARFIHTAVWTGSEMIGLGGIRPFGDFKHGREILRRYSESDTQVTPNPRPSSDPLAAKGG